MFLYNLTLQPSRAAVKAVCGNFSGSKQQEIVIAQNSSIELLKLDINTGKLCTILRCNVFGIIRSVVAFRIIGSLKDYLVIASDSGRLVILNYDPNRNVFDKVQEETYGKSGCRRIVPGQYLTADPKGRAVMIGAIEKQRLVYILNRDLATNLTISSPLEVHRTCTLIHDIIGIDVGFENPVFANIEVDYSEADQDPTGEAFNNTQKNLTYYELDLGLNHVVRKGSDVIDPTSNLLIVIPGGADGPGGLLVCSENFITWMKKDCTPTRIPIPRRPMPVLANDNERGSSGVLIVAAVMHRLKSGFFVLAQTEEGDIFKVTMDYVVTSEAGASLVKNLKIKYFDTVPIATSMCLLKSGFLFIASEFGDHQLYQIEDLGNNDTEQIEYNSIDIKMEDLNVPIFFKPRPLRNLAAVDTILSLSPLTAAEAVHVTPGENPYIHTLCGRGSKSSLRIVRHGLEVMQLAISELPGIPSAVWTIRKSAMDEYDSYIVVSFTNATLVLSVGEVVEEVTNSVLLTSVSTIMIAQLGDDALTQIYPHGVRYIRSGRRNEWKSMDNKLIVKAACNQKQIVIALTGGELVYFELDATGHINEYKERKELSSEVTAITIGSVPPGRQRCSFLAVGCADNTIRIISLDPDSCLRLLSVQVLRWTPSSLVLSDAEPGQNSDNYSANDPLHITIGLSSGIVMGALIDKTTGIISNSRVKYLGVKPVKLFPVSVDGKSAIMALSSRSWLCLNNNNTYRHVPLIYDTLDYASKFKSEQFTEAIVGIAGNTLRVIMVEDTSNTFSQTIIPLEYTPRKLTLHKPSNKFVVIESEHGTYCKSMIEQMYNVNSGATENSAEKENCNHQSKKLELPSPEQFGNPRAPLGNWASCITLVDPIKAEKVYREVLDNNEAAFGVTTCVFQEKQDTHCVAVSVAKDVTLTPLSCFEAHIALYSMDEDGTKLDLMHKTPIEGVAHALCPFQGRLLVGIGNTLRMYSIGKKRLLRRCETSRFPNSIVSIETQGNRIIVCDIQESVFYAMYKPFDNRIIVFADDTMPRWVVCSTMLDYDTVCCGDKFGSISVVRLPKEISQEVDEDSTGNRFAYEKRYLHGAPHKVSHVAEFFVGETISSVSNISMVSDGTPVILYTTFLGGIGVLIPFAYKDDADLFQTLEMQMRSRMPPLSGRDHLSYRSYYIPVHRVVDGDLCEMFDLLPQDAKAEIAGELEREVNELSRKIREMRDKFAF